jgi:hypothetical protein
MKRAMVSAVLLIAVIWPLLHYGLVARYQLNPWKFGAWAMYTSPNLPVLAAVFTQVAEGYRLIAPESWPAEVREARRQFEMRRNDLGVLARPDKLAAAALAARPDLDNVVVLVQRFTLDPSSALTVSTKEQYVYPRSK